MGGGRLREVVAYGGSTVYLDNILFVCFFNKHYSERLYIKCILQNQVGFVI